MNLQEETIGINTISSEETVGVNDSFYRKNEEKPNDLSNRRFEQIKNDYRDIWERLDELYKEGEIITKDREENTSKEKHLSHYFTPDQNHNKKPVHKTIIPSVTDLLDYFGSH